MQVIFAINPVLLDQEPHFPGLWKLGWLAFLFTCLGLGLAHLWFGQSTRRLRKARYESLQLAERSSEMGETLDQVFQKLQKMGAVYEANLSYRNQKVEQIQKEKIKFQADLNEKIKGETHFAGVLRNKDREIERLKVEMEKYTAAQVITFAEKDKEILELRKDLAKTEGIYSRLGELEAVIEERDVQIKDLLSRNATTAQQTESKDKIKNLEQLLTNRDNELSRLRNDRDKLRQDLESTLRNRENKIMELEDTLGERESMLVALENELLDYHKKDKVVADLENLVAERDLEIEEFTQNKATKGSLQNELNHLRQEVQQRESEISNIKKQHHDAKQQRETKLREATAQIETQNAELKSLRALQSTIDKSKARISELENSLEHKEGELHQIVTEKQNDLEKLLFEKGEFENQLRAKDDELETLRREKGARETLVSRVQELEWLLGERSGALDKLNLDHAEKKSEVERLISQKNDMAALLHAKEAEVERIAEMERIAESVREAHLRDVERIAESIREAHLREAEIDQLSLEKQELAHLLRLKESDAESIRKERRSFESIQQRLTDLERILSERERELDRLKSGRDEELYRLKRENADLLSHLRSSAPAVREERLPSKVTPALAEVPNFSVLRAERITADDHYSRNGEIKAVPVAKARKIERESNDDILARLRELERMVEERLHSASVDREERLPPPTVVLREEPGTKNQEPRTRNFQSEFRFTLADGSVTYLKRDDTIEYEGKIHRAEDLYYLLERPPRST